jgi:PTH1 family peptidyl-tRNA hydrolase
VQTERLIVIHDELDLPFGALRLKFGGGDNGHNGLKSIRKALGTGDFFRVRAGIGRPMGRQSPADYVLQVFSGAERSELPGYLDRCARAVECLVEDGLETAQNRYNAAPATSGDTS